MKYLVVLLLLVGCGPTSKYEVGDCIIAALNCGSTCKPEHYRIANVEQQYYALQIDPCYKYCVLPDNTGCYIRCDLFRLNGEPKIDKKMLEERSVKADCIGSY